MKLGIYRPQPRLRPYIRQIVVQENSLEQLYKILPCSSLVMGFQYRGRLAQVEQSIEKPLAPAGITGLGDSFRLFKNSPDIGTILVFFQESGAYPFFRMSLHELFGVSLALDTFFPKSRLDHLAEQLHETATDSARVQQVEHFLLESLQPTSADPLVLNALHEIAQHQGQLSIAELAKRVNSSQSPLEKRFRMWVGASPKKFSSIVRLNHVLSLLPTAESLTSLAYQTGYFDQSHFIRDFQAFTGQSPEQYRKTLLVR